MKMNHEFFFVAIYLLSAAERRGTPVLLSASVSDNFSNSPQIAAPRRSREIDQSTQRFYVGWFHVGWQGTGDQSDATQISERYQYYYKPGQSLGEGFLYQESAVWESTIYPTHRVYCDNSCNADSHITLHKERLCINNI